MGDHADVRAKRAVQERNFGDVEFEGKRNITTDRLTLDRVDVDLLVVSIAFAIRASEDQGLHVDRIFDDFLEDRPLEMKSYAEGCGINSATASMDQHSDISWTDEDQTVPDNNKSCDGN